MERGSQFSYFWKCRGEVFRIVGIYNDNGVVVTCDKVAVYYSLGWGAGLLNTDCDLSACDDDDLMFVSKHDACADNVFRIEVIGKPCGVPVRDRDTIEFTNYYTGVKLRRRANAFCYYSLFGCVSDGTYQYPKFTIFRSDVSHDYFYSHLPCNE